MKKLVLLLPLLIILSGCKKEFKEPEYGPGSVVYYDIECQNCDVQLPELMGKEDAVFRVNGLWSYSHFLGPRKVIPLEIRTPSIFPTTIQVRWYMDGVVLLHESAIIDNRNEYKRSIDISKYLKN